MHAFHYAKKHKCIKPSHLEMLLENVTCAVYVKQIRFINIMFQIQVTNRKSKIKSLFYPNFLNRYEVCYNFNRQVRNSGNKVLEELWSSSLLKFLRVILNLFLVARKFHYKDNNKGCYCCGLWPKSSNLGRTDRGKSWGSGICFLSCLLNSGSRKLYICGCSCISLKFRQ